MWFLMWLSLLQLTCPVGTFEITTYPVAETREFIECRPPETFGPQQVCAYDFLDVDGEVLGIDWVVVNPAYNIPAVILEYADGTTEVQPYMPFGIFVNYYAELQPGDYGVYHAGTGTPLKQVTWCAQNNHRIFTPTIFR